MLPDNFYPPTVAFKRAVEKTLDEVLEDRIYDLVWKHVHITSIFESIAEWGQTVVGASSTIALDSQEVTMTTDANTNDSCKLFKNPKIQGIISFSSKSRFRASIKLDSITAQTAYITVGNVQGGAQGYGFKVVNATLYGVTHDGSSEQTTTLLTLSANLEYSIEARYKPSKGVVFLASDPNLNPASELREVGSNSVKIPSSARATNDYLIDFYIRTDADAAKILYLSHFGYLQIINYNA